MSSPLHADLGIGVEIHAMVRWEHADSAARASETVTSDDIGKISWQQDTDTFYMLKNATPTWVALTGGIESVLADTSPQAGGDFDLNGHDLTDASGSNVNIDSADGYAVDLRVNNTSVMAVGAAEIEAKQSLQYNENVYQDALYDAGNSGAALTIAPANGNYQKFTLTDDCTLTITAPSGPCTIHLHVYQDATGSRVLTLPSYYTSGGTALSFSTAASAHDLLIGEYDGTNWIFQAITNVAVVS